MLVSGSPTDPKFYPRPYKILLIFGKKKEKKNPCWRKRKSSDQQTTNVKWEVTLAGPNWHAKKWRLSTITQFEVTGEPIKIIKMRNLR